jgi:uncharacterized GH25 family protein
MNLRNMSHFTIKVLYKHGNPAEDIGVMIDYGWLSGCEEKKTDSDGCVDFYNQENKSGIITVLGQSMGSHSLTEGESYSFTI